MQWIRNKSKNIQFKCIVDHEGEIAMREVLKRESPEVPNGDADIIFRTAILNDATEGSDSAEALLAPLIYQKLRRMARHFLSKERSGHTLQATELVHEAYLRLFDQSDSSPKSQTHFISLAAIMMRRILINHALAKKTSKRGAGIVNLTLGAAENVKDSTGESEVDILALDAALSELSKLDERMAKIVELRYFGGLSIDDTAATLSISPATVKREWQMAKLWLKKRLDSAL